MRCAEVAGLRPVPLRSSAMVDRATRDKCAAIIEAFLAGYTTNHVYDHAMDSVAWEQRDDSDAVCVSGKTGIEARRGGFYPHTKLARLSAV